jgi:hypothetical protein
LVRQRTDFPTRHVARLSQRARSSLQAARASPELTGGRYTMMRYALASTVGQQLYRKRMQTIEPVFGHTRHNRGVTRFLRRGRTAVRTEWRLLMMTHNLSKLHSHEIATVRA